MGRIPRILIAAFCTLMTSQIHAQAVPAKDQAKKMLERLTGVKWPAESPVLAQMTTLITQGKRLEAAQVATAQPQFYNVTVKQMAAQMSTREESLRTGLNDFQASFIGVTRDNVDARTLLYGDYFYKGDSTKIAAAAVRDNLKDDLLVSNNHFADLESKKLNLADVLVRVDGQRLIASTNGDNKDTVVNPDPAGVLTSRAFMEAHADAGTNRRLVEYTMREFMCVKMEDWKDVDAADLRIGRDIDRFPGGDNAVFLTTCKGCHTGMDGFRGAFARWDFTNSAALHTLSDGAKPGMDRPNATVTKMNKNGTVFPSGYVTLDDSFVNNAVRNANAALFGWRKPAGNYEARGVRGFGQLVASSVRFGQCMAQRVFDSVCKKSLSAEEKANINLQFGADFETNQGRLKRLFEVIAADPRCQ